MRGFADVMKDPRWGGDSESCRWVQNSIIREGQVVWDSVLVEVTVERAVGGGCAPGNVGSLKELRRAGQRCPWNPGRAQPILILTLAQCFISDF